jgi:hypothetical protein
MSGYSLTPLSRKLGIEAGRVVCVLAAPADYRKTLAPIPEGVRFLARPGASAEIVHLFVTRRTELERRLASLRKLLRPDAAIWVSWPKKASGVPTDVTEDTIRRVALPMGFVDVKVCAVTDVWSGLKLVVRRELR